MENGVCQLTNTMKAPVKANSKLSAFTKPINTCLIEWFLKACLSFEKVAKGHLVGRFVSWDWFGLMSVPLRNSHGEQSFVPAHELSWTQCMSCAMVTADPLYGIPKFSWNRWTIPDMLASVCSGIPFPHSPHSSKHMACLFPTMVFNGRAQSVWRAHC